MNSTKYGSKCKISRFEFIDMHHVTKGCVIRVENTAVDTAKKLHFVSPKNMCFGTKENWVDMWWIEAAARELSKTTPLHPKPHRIYHAVVRSWTVTERRFQNCPAKVNGERAMELLEGSPAPVALPAPIAVAPNEKDAIDLTTDSNSEFYFVPVAVPVAVAVVPTKKDPVDLTKESDSGLDSESGSSDEDSVLSVDSNAYFSCNEPMPSNYDSGHDSVADLFCAVDSDSRLYFG